MHSPLAHACTINCRWLHPCALNCVKVILVWEKIVIVLIDRHIIVTTTYKAFQKGIYVADVGMACTLHWLTKYTNKICHAHSDMHSIPCMAILIIQQP